MKTIDSFSLVNELRGGGEDVTPALTGGRAQDKISKDPTTHGAAFVPIILGSDKTTVSVGMGDNVYWPLYISIGNIHNNTCCSHCGGVVLIGFLADPKSECLASC